MYLIQQTTKQPTDEILGFFYDFGKEAVSQALTTFKRSQRSFKRSIENYYPDTVIPFCIKLEGNINSNHMLTSCSISVSFPENAQYIDTKEIMNIIMERTLLGGSAMPDFEAPATFASKGYKDLVERVLRKRNEQTILDSGHSRQARSSKETLE